MKIILLQTGKTSEKYIAEGVDEFSSRIKKYAVFETLTIPEQKNTKKMPVEEQKIREGRLILKAVTRDDYLVILDEKGREHNTREFADRLEKIFQLSRKRVVFVIGGPWGFSNDVYERADMKFSLSRLTFSHQLVRLLFAEQLYRVLTLIKGDPYHHE